MSASCYLAWSATTAALTAPPVAASSSSSANTVATVQQLKATQLIRVVEWGYTISATPAGPCQIELVDTGAVAATMPNAFASGDIIKYNNSQADAAPLTLGTGSSGYGKATAEGTVTATRLLDYQYESGLYIKKQIPLGREPEVPSTNYLRIRITPTTAAAISIVGYIIFEA